MSHTDIEPVRVHVANAHELAPPQKRRKGLKATGQTIVLSATNPVAELLPQDPRRHYALVQALGADVIICHSETQANAAANQATGLPNPAGYLLSHTNTSPTRIEGQEQMWVTNDNHSAGVAVMVFTELD